VIIFTGEGDLALLPPAATSASAANEGYLGEDGVAAPQRYSTCSG